MRCAFDLVTTANFIAEEKERLKTIQEQLEREELRVRTIQYCEKLGAELEQKSEKGEQPIIDFHCSHNGTPLVATFSDYADRRLSFNWSKTGKIDLELMKQWFADYCFQVKTTPYDYYCYGLGVCSGYLVKISPAPQCV